MAIIIYFAQYEPKSLKFGQPAQFGGELDTYEWERPWVKIQLCPNFGEEVLRGQSRKNYSFVSQSMKNPKFYIIPKNQPSWSIRREDVKGFPFFVLKRTCSSLMSPLLNLNWEVEI